MNLLLRSASVLGLLAAALAASAQVTYSFVGTLANNPQSFSFTTSSFIVSNTKVTAFTASSNVSQAFFDLTDFPEPNIQAANGGAIIYSFRTGDFGSVGVKTGTTSNGGVLTITGAPTPTPEPSALAALGLGTVAFVKRRKRA